MNASTPYKQAAHCVYRVRVLADRILFLLGLLPYIVGNLGSFLYCSAFVVIHLACVATIYNSFFTYSRCNRQQSGASSSTVLLTE